MENIKVSWVVTKTELAKTDRKYVSLNRIYRI